MSRAAREGISTNEKSIGIAVQQVMTFLYLGKSDARGEFQDLSESQVIKLQEISSCKPDYYSKIQKCLEPRLLDSAAIVGISSFKCSDLYRSALKLTSRDLNCCDFSVQLATCLVLESSNIYIECSKLNKRGLKRLIRILQEFRRLFDNRSCVILICEVSLAPELQQITENDVSCVETPSKKAKIDGSQGLQNAGENSKGTLKEEKNKLGKSIHPLKAENDRLLLNYKNLNDEYEALKIDKDRLQSELDDLDIHIDRSKLEVEVDKENLQAEIVRLKGERDKWRVECDNLRTEKGEIRIANENLKVQKNNLQVESNRMKAERKGLEEETDSLKIENEGFRLEKERLMVEKNDLAEERDCLMVVRENLWIERDDLRVESDGLREERNGLRVERDDLRVERDDLKMVMGNMEKEQDRLKAGRECMKVGNVGVLQTEGERSNSAAVGLEFENIRNAISLNQLKMVKSSAPEIVQRSIPKLYFTSKTECVSGNYIFSLTILKPEILNSSIKFKNIQGNGKNRKLAKRKAFENLVNVILNNNSG